MKLSSDAEIGDIEKVSQPPRDGFCSCFVLGFVNTPPPVLLSLSVPIPLGLDLALALGPFVVSARRNPFPQ